MKLFFFRRYKSVAYLPTIYAILQYVLLKPSGLNDTLFLIDQICQADLIIRFPHHCFLLNIGQSQPFKNRLKFYYNHIFIYFLSRRCHTIYLSGNPSYANFSTYCFDHVICMEDGIGNYRVLKDGIGGSLSVPQKGKLSNRVFGPKFPIFGWADKVEKIYLTGVLPIPAGIAGKVELLNLKELWAQRSPEEQEAICRIFLPEVSKPVQSLSREVLLLTQPFSEDSCGMFSEQEKIEVYRTILAGIDESTVLIKVHPREKTDYKKYFPHAEVLYTLCPMELLEILGLKTQKAITINSTAIHHLDNSVEKIITGMSVNPQLHKEMIRRWGVGKEFGY